MFLSIMLKMLTVEGELEHYFLVNHYGSIDNRKA